ncbi:MAG: hypothetical protein IJC88_00060 [Oscillospiraceae bacterium]|nr:hypothetical protein [Oscillospiraceae bacterium]
MKLTWMLLILCILCGCGQAEVKPEVAAKDLPRMVWAEESLYVDTGRVSENTPRCGVMDGEIVSQVAQNEIPTEESTSNFGTGFGYQIGADPNTIELLIDGEWCIFYEMQKPPEMRVLHGEESAPCMRGGFSWTSITKDGKAQTVIADALHPLECKELAPILTLRPSIYSSVDPNLAHLEFSLPPDQITARCWSVRAWDQPMTEAESVEVQDSALFLKENCVYEITAIWETQKGFGGEVHYVFVAKPSKLCGYPVKE